MGNDKDKDKRGRVKDRDRVMLGSVKV